MLDAPAASCALGSGVCTRVFTAEAPDTSGIPHAMVLTVSFVISPAIGLSCHRHPRDAKHHRELDASVEASGPHDFAVRLSAVRYRHLRVHRIPPRVRDDREPPLMWDGTAENKPVIWVWCEEEIFLQRGLDRQPQNRASGQINKCSPHARSDMRGQRQPHFRMSRSLSSGGHSPDPVARNDEEALPQITRAAFNFAISSVSQPVGQFCRAG